MTPGKSASLNIWPNPTRSTRLVGLYWWWYWWTRERTISDLSASRNSWWVQRRDRRGFVSGDAGCQPVIGRDPEASSTHYCPLHEHHDPWGPHAVGGVQECNVLAHVFLWHTRTQDCRVLWVVEKGGNKVTARPVKMNKSSDLQCIIKYIFFYSSLFSQLRINWKIISILHSFISISIILI